MTLPPDTPATDDDLAALPDRARKAVAVLEAIRDDRSLLEALANELMVDVNLEALESEK